MEKEDLASTWLSKVEKSNKYYDDWSNKYKCDQLEQYYYGFQWAPENNYDHYVINYIFSTIEIKKPSLLFQNPVFNVKPKQSKSDYDMDTAVRKAQMRTDALNTIFQDPEQGFGEELDLFITDAFFRFGVMEVGYSADWLLNPNAGKPVLRSDNTPYFDESNNVLRQPDELPENEKIYIKRIRPWRFRVGGIDGHSFKHCSWAGYYEFTRLEDLRANKQFKIDDKISWMGARSDDFVDSSLSEDERELASTGDLIKVWKIWDFRAKVQHIIADYQKSYLGGRKFKHVPIVTLKFINAMRGWYPVPAVFNWKSPQDEINEIREQRKVHRKRFKRVYLVREGAFEDDNDKAKLEHGPDGTVIDVQGDPSTAVVPVPLATLDPSATESMITSADDMNRITGTSEEMRGRSDRTTATQANIIDSRARIREGKMQSQVANTLCLIARLALINLQEKMVLPFWVKTQIDSDQSMMQEMQEVQTIWKEITSSDIGSDVDFEVDIDVDSMSPVANDEEKRKFLEFLAILNTYPQLSMSPTLVREAAYRCGYRNEKVIKELQQLAMIAMMGQAQMGQQNLGQQQGTTNQAQTKVEQMTPPDMAQIGTQLGNQLQ